MVPFSEDDWDRIIFALSHFSHNADYRATLERVLAARGRAR